MIATLDVPCPVCAAKPVDCMLPTSGGAYCHCAACGAMWHQEGVVASRRSSRSQRRRRYTEVSTDPMSAADVPALRRRVAQLEWENAMLRQSAMSFADLAERLNAQLRVIHRRSRR